MKTSDCGCGGSSGGTHTAAHASTNTSAGSGGSGGGGCGGHCGGNCGGAAGSSGSLFVRPRFFGGMLLTEDDLQAIDNYTMAKRRYTNRHMFGPGVVCGLDVDCDPCKPGWLFVDPGYALDCCGNDIIVPCAEHIDALALLSELRKRDANCDDPCDDEQRRNYLLVVSYDEQPTDAVAPYSQDDCAVGDCQFTRVREGYRFELVTEVADSEPSLFDRLKECAETGEEKIREDAVMLTRLARMATVQARVTAAEESGVAAAVTVPSAREFDEYGTIGNASIVKAAALLSRSTAVLAAAAAHDANLGPEVPLNPSSRRAITERSRKLAAALAASGSLQALPAAEQTRVRLALKAATDLQGVSTLGLAEQLFTAEGFDPGEVHREYVADAVQMRSRILDRLEKAGKGNCREREDVERLRMDRLDQYSLSTVQELARSFLSVIDCLCDLINPPCPTCTDNRVLLARIQIEGCEVVDVCDVNREWVLAPRTLNYWVPVADLLRPLLGRRCCCRESKREMVGKPIGGTEVEALQAEAMRSVARLRAPSEAPEFADLLGLLEQPAVAVPVVPPKPPAPASPAPSPVPATDPMETLRAEMQKQIADLREQVRKLNEARP